MLIPLREAVVEECGGKAATLGMLLRAGLTAPDGFVVGFRQFRDVIADPPPAAARPAETARWRRTVLDTALPAPLLDDLDRAWQAFGGTPLAVRSSAADEDSPGASGAGQYATVLGPSRFPDVVAAIRACWASLGSDRAVAYRTGAPTAGPTAMAVLIQPLVDAAVSGVMFTPTESADPTTIEAAWGLGPGVVGGTVTPDRFRIAPSGAVDARIADKPTKLEHDGDRLVERAVPDPDRTRPVLSDEQARHLGRIGGQVAGLLDGPQDIEWAIADGRILILQARPITTALPPPNIPGPPPAALAGTPAAGGTVTGPARILRGPGDFGRLVAGDIIVCEFTDPAWTPLFAVAGGIVTERGGVLSHAAIVARERGIPAVVGVPDAIARFSDGTLVTVDGGSGTVTPTPL